MIEIETIEHFGVRLELDPAVMSPKMIAVMRASRFERQEAKQLDLILEDDEIVLEIGAGIGFISTLLTKSDKTKRVVSYEANPDLLPVIEKTVLNNLNDKAGKHSVRNAILSNDMSHRNVAFYIHRDFWASSLLPLENPLRVDKIPMRSFNSALKEIRPTLIVCDIEGAELNLFTGAKLEGVKKIYLEIHQKKLGGSGIRDLFEVMHNHGFHYDQHHSNGAVVLFLRIEHSFAIPI